MVTIDQKRNAATVRNAGLASGERVEIRRCSVADLASIARLQRSCFEGGQAYGLVTLLLFQLWPRAHVLLANSGERIVGCIIGDVQRDQARILNICVDPRYRRQGLGSALLCSMESLLDHDNVTLMVEDKNEAAQTLYRRHGFMQCGDLRDYYGRNRHGVLMQKRRVHPALGYRPALVISDQRDEDEY